MIEKVTLWQEDINHIASETCDFIQEKLSIYMIQLDTTKEDELFDLVLNFLDEYSAGYRNNN